MGVSRSEENAGLSKVNVDFALILRISDMTRMGDIKGSHRKIPRPHQGCQEGTTGFGWRSER